MGVPIPDEAYEFYGCGRIVGFEAKSTSSIERPCTQDTSDSIENEIEELDSKIKGYYIRTVIEKIA